MELTKIQFEDITEGGDFEAVGSSEITGTSRWSTFYTQIYRKISDNTYWELSWSRGSTEMQDEGVEDMEFHLVKPQEVTVIQYVRV